MISLKDMLYDDLKEQIESCKDALEECTPGTCDYNSLKSVLVVAEKELKQRKEKLHKQIIRDITEPDTMSKEEANYTSYLEFLSDSEMGNQGYEEVLFENFEEEELERLWRDSHYTEIS